MLSRILLTPIKFTLTTEAIPEIIHQPELLMGTTDRENMIKSYGGANVYSFEQRIKFIVDFKTAEIYDKYLNSLIESNELPDLARSHVDLLSHDIKVIDGKYYFDKQRISTGIQYIYGEKSTMGKFLDFVDVKDKNNQVVVSLVSINVLNGFNLYKHITGPENGNKSWQFRLVLKDDSDKRRGYVPLTLLTEVFVVDRSTIPHRLLFLEEYLE